MASCVSTMTLICSPSTTNKTDVARVVRVYEQDKKEEEEVEVSHTIWGGELVTTQGCVRMGRRACADATTTQDTQHIIASFIYLVVELF